MKRLAEQNGLPPIMAVLLYRGSVDPDQNDFIHPKGNLAKSIRLLQFFGNELRKAEFQVIDPLPSFKKYSGMALAVSEWDMHPNYLAHYLYAKSISSSLSTNQAFKN